MATRPARRRPANPDTRKYGRRGTDPAGNPPITVEWLGCESAAMRFGIPFRRLVRLCESGEITAEWAARSDADRGFGWWIYIPSIREYQARAAAALATDAEYEHGRILPTDSDRPVLYGLLTASDAAELERRRDLAARPGRLIPLPTIDTPQPFCPDCARAVRIETNVRQRAARPTRGHHV